MQYDIEAIADKFDIKTAAMVQFCGLCPEDISWRGDVADVDGEEYLVLTDSEADELHFERLDSYIDECILPEIPEAYRSYFDAEKWKRDADMNDGRGHLASYDSEEREEKVCGEWIYIYRIG